MENEILATHVIPRIFVCAVILRGMSLKKREKVFCLVLEKSPGSFIIAFIISLLTIRPSSMLG